MRPIRILVVAAITVFTVVSALAASAEAASQRWVVTDLGTLGGYYAGATAINNRGQVVGYAATMSKDRTGRYISHAFLWENGRMRDLGVSARDFGENKAVA